MPLVRPEPGTSQSQVEHSLCSSQCQVLSAPNISQNLMSATIIIAALRVNPYPTTSFCPENVVCLKCLLYIFKCTSD